MPTDSTTPLPTWTAPVTDLGLRVWARTKRISPEMGDALLYGVSALFALLTILVALHLSITSRTPLKLASSSWERWKIWKTLLHTTLMLRIFCLPIILSIRRSDRYLHPVFSCSLISRRKQMTVCI